MTTTMSTAITRTTGLARANALLMLRNNLTMAYALVMPLLPMALLLTGERGDVEIGMAAVGSALMLVLLFSVYYNLLSSMVTRRDELVLKRLRTGETRDSELLLSMALPGVTVTLVLSVVLIGLGAALGLPLPLNPLLFAATVLVASAAFASLAIWTAAWTRNAEAAQMTSMPIILLTVVGAQPLPDSWSRFVDLTPGAALDGLMRLTWFGRDGDATVDLSSTWAASGIPLLVLVFWTGLGIWLARRSMRWEPRV